MQHLEACEGVVEGLALLLARLELLAPSAALTLLVCHLRLRLFQLRLERPALLAQRLHLLRRRRRRRRRRRATGRVTAVRPIGIANVTTAARPRAPAVALEAREAILGGLQLGAQCGVGALELIGGEDCVDDRGVAHTLGARGEAQRGEGLGGVVRRGRARHQHHRFRVAAERLLQDARELRVAVRDVRLAVGEGGDDEAEGREGGVDLLGFLKRLARRSRLRHLLRPRQVRQVEPRHLGGPVGKLLLEVDCEQRVAARRLRVHQRGADHPGGVAARDAVEDVRGAHHGHLGQPLHVHAFAHRLANRERGVWVRRRAAARHARGLQQVAHGLLVNLEVGAAYPELRAARVRLQRLEHLPHRPRQQAERLLVATEDAHDGVSFARSGLPVGEQGGVVPLQHGVHQWSRVRVHFALRRLRPQDGIERVLAARVVAAKVQAHGAPVVAETEAARGIPVLEGTLAFVQRAEAADHADVLFRHAGEGAAEGRGAPRFQSGQQGLHMSYLRAVGLWLCLPTACQGGKTKVSDYPVEL